MGTRCDSIEGQEVTKAVHIVMDVTWPATLSVEAGSGQVHLWMKFVTTVNGGVVTGASYSCGTQLPITTLTLAGELVTGGTNLHIELPLSIWDSPSMPVFNITGTMSGWNVGDTLDMDPSPGLMGLTMDNPDAPWPDLYNGSTGLTPQDHDGDGTPGLTAVPKTDQPGFVNPPTALGAFGTQPGADEVYMVFRSKMQLSGTAVSCAEEEGTVDVLNLDNHVIGCHVAGGGECETAQWDFVDTNRAKYSPTPGGATYASRTIDGGSTCAQVRAVLPAI